MPSPVLDFAPDGERLFKVAYRLLVLAEGLVRARQVVKGEALPSKIKQLFEDPSRFLAIRGRFAKLKLLPTVSSCYN